jgi:ABC transporter substrate binding protein
METLRPTTQPTSCNPCRNAATRLCPWPVLGRLADNIKGTACRTNAARRGSHGHATGRTWSSAPCCFRSRPHGPGLERRRDIRFDIRWGANTAEKSRTLAAELLALKPDVILVSGSSATAAMRQPSTTTPITFTLVADPVGAGFVESLSRPVRNVTGLHYSSTPSAENGSPC